MQKDITDIGLRTLKNVTQGKIIRKNSKGYDIFQDYFSDSDSVEIDITPDSKSSSSSKNAVQSTLTPKRKSSGKNISRHTDKISLNSRQPDDHIKDTRHSTPKTRLNASDKHVSRELTYVTSSVHTDSDATYIRNNSDRSTSENTLSPPKSANAPIQERPYPTESSQRRSSRFNGTDRGSWTGMNQSKDILDNDGLSPVAQLDYDNESSGRSTPQDNSDPYKSPNPIRKGIIDLLLGSDEEEDDSPDDYERNTRNKRLKHNENSDIRNNEPSPEHNVTKKHSTHSSIKKRNRRSIDGEGVSHNISRCPDEVTNSRNMSNIITSIRAKLSHQISEDLHHGEVDEQFSALHHGKSRKRSIGASEDSSRVSEISSHDIPHRNQSSDTVMKNICKSPLEVKRKRQTRELDHSPEVSVIRGGNLRHFVSSQPKGTQHKSPRKENRVDEDNSDQLVITATSRSHPKKSRKLVAKLPVDSSKLSNNQDRSTSQADHGGSVSHDRNTSLTDHTRSTLQTSHGRSTSQTQHDRSTSQTVHDVSKGHKRSKPQRMKQDRKQNQTRTKHDITPRSPRLRSEIIKESKREESRNITKIDYCPTVQLDHPNIRPDSKNPKKQKASKHVRKPEKDVSSDSVSLQKNSREMSKNELAGKKVPTPGVRRSQRTRVRIVEMGVERINYRSVLLNGITVLEVDSVSQCSDDFEVQKNNAEKEVSKHGVKEKEIKKRVGMKAKPLKITKDTSKKKVIGSDDCSDNCDEEGDPDNVELIKEYSKHSDKESELRKGDEQRIKTLKTSKDTSKEKMVEKFNTESENDVNDNSDEHDDLPLPNDLELRKKSSKRGDKGNEIKRRDEMKTKTQKIVKDTSKKKVVDKFAIDSDDNDEEDDPTVPNNLELNESVKEASKRRIKENEIQKRDGTKSKNRKLTKDSSKRKGVKRFAMGSDDDSDEADDPTFPNYLELRDEAHDNNIKENEMTKRSETKKNTLNITKDTSKRKLTNNFVLNSVYTKSSDEEGRASPPHYIELNRPGREVTKQSNKKRGKKKNDRQKERTERRLSKNSAGNSLDDDSNYGDEEHHKLTHDISSKWFLFSENMEYFGQNGVLNEYEDDEPYLISIDYLTEDAQSGEILFRGHSLKEYSLMESKTLHCTVVYGEFEVAIFDSVCQLRYRDQFIVPPGVPYSVLNLQDTTSILSYSIFSVNNQKRL